MMSMSMPLRQVVVGGVVLASVHLRQVVVDKASRGSSPVSLLEKGARGLAGGPPSPSVVGPSLHGTAGISSLWGETAWCVVCDILQ
jgi:hypothetical protein